MREFLKRIYWFDHVLYLLMVILAWLKMIRITNLNVVSFPAGRKTLWLNSMMHWWFETRSSWFSMTHLKRVVKNLSSGPRWRRFDCRLLLAPFFGVQYVPSADTGALNFQSHSFFLYFLSNIYQLWLFPDCPWRPYRKLLWAAGWKTHFLYRMALTKIHAILRLLELNWILVLVGLAWFFEHGKVVSSDIMKYFNWFVYSCEWPSSS